jgi:hypothetical protein
VAELIIQGNLNALTWEEERQWVIELEVSNIFENTLYEE